MRLNKGIYSSFLSVFICLIGFSGSLCAAPSYDPQSAPLVSISVLENNTKNMSDEDARIYRASFDNITLQGELIEYVLASTSGNLSASSDVSVNNDSPEGKGRQWSANYNFSLKDAGWWDTGRKVIFFSQSQQQPFRWNKLDIVQQTQLISQQHVDYIRGNRALDGTNGFRARGSILGPIIHSNPTYVGIPQEFYISSSYIDFIEANKLREPQLIVGANDGMVHVFNAKTGEENYAYVPSMILSELHEYTKPYSDHPYFADGGIQARDVQLGGDWATVAVGGLGRGGKGLWALNVTDPDLINENSKSPQNKKILWEMDASGNNDLGYIYDKPSIVRLKEQDGSSKFYVVVGNGYLSSSGLAKLLVIDIETGNVVKTISASSDGEPLAPNGLSMPALIDTDRDGIVDLGYAGTINGELVKFSFGAGPGQWEKVATLFVTAGQAATPIITTPQVSKHPSPYQSGYMIYFPTGRVFSDADVADAVDQWLYGIWDRDAANTQTVQNGNLIEQTFSGPLSSSHNRPVYSISNAPIPWETATVPGKRGWRVKLLSGTKIVTNLAMRSGRIKFSLTRPATEENWSGEVSFANGGIPDGKAVFDINHDGEFDERDSADNGSRVVMVKTLEGKQSGPLVLRVGDDAEVLLRNHIKLSVLAAQPPPPVNPPDPTPELCNSDCDGGLLGGHFDADSYIVNPMASWAKKGGHEHEYDVLYKTNAVDLLNPYGSRVKPFVITDPAQKFVVILGNADLSTAGVITIGKTSWNVLEYQTIIHEKLVTWDGISPLLDDNGSALSFTQADVTCAGCTLKISFPLNALLEGGLHPTNTKCVNDVDDWPDDPINGRPRDGALLAYVFKATAGASAKGLIDKLRPLQPRDSIPKMLINTSNGIKAVENKQVVRDGVTTTIGLSGLVPDVNAEVDYVYGLSIFWHYQGACYRDHQNWLHDQAEVINQGYFCGRSGDAIQASSSPPYVAEAYNGYYPIRFTLYNAAGTVQEAFISFTHAEACSKVRYANAMEGKLTIDFNSCKIEDTSPGAPCLPGLDNDDTWNQYSNVRKNISEFLVNACLDDFDSTSYEMLTPISALVCDTYKTGDANLDQFLVHIGLDVGLMATSFHNVYNSIQRFCHNPQNATNRFYGSLCTNGGRLNRDLDALYRSYLPAGGGNNNRGGNNNGVGNNNGGGNDPDPNNGPIVFPTTPFIVVEKNPWITPNLPDLLPTRSSASKPGRKSIILSQ